MIEGDAEAIEVAHRFAATIAAGASARDRERILPRVELDAFSATSLGGVVPKAYGGAGVSYVTVGEVFKIVGRQSEHRPNSANHSGVLRHRADRRVGAAKAIFFADVLQGKHFGNAFSERHSKYGAEFLTCPRSRRPICRRWQKFYSTGALFADWIPIAATAEDGKPYLAVVEQGAPGLEIIDDWSGFGQRTTASGTVLIRNVSVAPEHVIPAYLAYEQPSANGPICQIIQAAIDAGIARAAIDDTIAFLREAARPWADSGLDHAYDDPYTIAAIGKTGETRYRAA